MNRILVPSLLLAVSMAFASCMDKDVYNPDRTDNDKPVLDLSFKFAMKSSKAVSISATDAFGNPGKGVLFNIYQENPFVDEGISHDAEPLYAGYTDQKGDLNTSIALPDNIKQIYVYPVTAGYGGLQTAEVADHISLTFQGIQFPTAATSRATSADISSFTSSLIAKRYNIHCVYNADDAAANGILIPGKSPLVSSESLSTDFLNLVNTWYPEKEFQHEEMLERSCDLVVTDVAGAEVWATYIGDGGFNEGRGVLMYYNYGAGSLSSNQDAYGGENPSAATLESLLHMTLLFPNTDSNEAPAGTKVQLLYWNGSKYETVFPQGTHIGFAFGRNSNKNGKAINSVDNYWFAQPWHSKLSSNNSHYPHYEMFYSTPELNGEGIYKSNAIIRSCPAYDCIVVGMDARYWDDSSPNNDRDYNDVLFKVMSNPPDGVTPETEIPVEPELPFDAQHGTLAFEDLWPSQGDYDFNDLVIDYTYKRLKNADGGISEVQLVFQAMARGGSITSGFGIELPFSESMVKNVTGATLEIGNGKATFIVWNNTDDVFGRHGIINTYKNQSAVGTAATTVSITLNSSLSDSQLDRLAFNPFIFVNGNRGQEIHLVDFVPTSKVDKAFFGQSDDRSEPDKGIYYRMDNTYPWALDIPRVSASVPSWRYPIESANITTVYLNYEKWAQDKTNTDWFDSSISGNVDEEKLY